MFNHHFKNIVKLDAQIIDLCNHLFKIIKYIIEKIILFHKLKN